jgi:hypothetical protein
MTHNTFPSQSLRHYSGKLLKLGRITKAAGDKLKFNQRKIIAVRQFL